MRKSGMKIHKKQWELFKSVDGVHFAKIIANQALSRICEDKDFIFVIDEIKIDEDDMMTIEWGEIYKTKVVEDG